MSKPLDVQLTGIHPRSEGFIQVTRDFDRGRTDEAAYREAQAAEIAHVLRVQTEIGSMAVTDGLYRFQDIFRPFAEHAEGLEVGALTRWFDNNTFYKQPVFTGGPRIDASHLAPYFPAVAAPASRAWKAILPGPATFARLSEDRHFRNEEKLALTIAEELLNPAVRFLAGAGVKHIQLNEPAVVTESGEKAAEDFAFLFDAVDAAFAGAEGVTRYVHTFFGDATPDLEALFGLDVDFVGVDLFRTPIEALEQFGPVAPGILAGVVDARNSFLERPDDVAALARRLLAVSGDAGVVLAPTTDLEFLPLKLADEKLRILAEARTRVAGGGA